MAGDALKGIYEALTPTSIPFPTVDPQYADLYDAWRKRTQATPVPRRYAFSEALDDAGEFFRSAPFALFLIFLGLALYLLLRRAQARAEEQSSRMSERVTARLTRPGRGSVEYTWRGKTYAGEIRLPRRDMNAGDDVVILLDPLEPECIRADGTAAGSLVPKLLALALVAAGLALLAFATF